MGRIPLSRLAIPGNIVVGAQNIDVFPLDRTQWRDTDGDWVGDEQMSGRWMDVQRFGAIHS